MKYNKYFKPTGSSLIVLKLFILQKGDFKMKSQYVVLLGFLAMCISINSYTQQMYASRYSGLGDGYNVGTAVTADTSGNAYVTGYTTGMISGHDITTIKYNPIGRLLWSATYDGDGGSTDEAYAIVKDALNNIYVPGASVGSGTDKDMVIIKYDPTGAQKWVRRYTSSGSHPDVSSAITIDASGNPIIAGYSYVNGGNAVTVIKYDPSGNQLWVRTGDGTSNTNVANAITVDNSSNIYVTGYTLPPGQNTYKLLMTLKYNPSGTRQWVSTSNGDCTNQDGEACSIVNDGSGNSFITGYIVTASQGKDYLTVKYNSSGAQQWLKTYNNAAANSDDIARKIVYPNGDVVVTGSSKSSAAAGSEDYLTVKYRGSDGNQQFALRYDDPLAHSTDIAYSVTKFGNNLFYITGSSVKSNVAGGEDMFTMVINGSGTVLTTYRVANPGPDCAYDVATDKYGNIYVAGFLGGSPEPTHNVMCDMACVKFGFGVPAANLTSVTNLESAIPNSFSLYQNYPNPFNPSTTIRFDVSQASNVKIAVYDLLGREVLAPVNEFKNPGSYEVTFSLNSLASGVYFYKMTAGNYTDIRKMTFTK